jgi:hypothetical protein
MTNEFKAIPAGEAAISGTITAFLPVPRSRARFCRSRTPRAWPQYIRLVQEALIMKRLKW